MELRYGENGEDVFKTFSKCEVEIDFIEFFKEQWKVCESAICKEKHIGWGQNRPIGETFDRVRSNLSYMLGHTTKMRADFAKKVWWFLYI